MPHRTGGVVVVQPQSVSIIGRLAANLGRGSILHNVASNADVAAYKEPHLHWPKGRRLFFQQLGIYSPQLRTPSLVWSVLQILRELPQSVESRVAANVGRSWHNAHDMKIAQTVTQKAMCEATTLLAAVDDEFVLLWIALLVVCST